MSRERALGRSKAILGQEAATHHSTLVERADPSVSTSSRAFAIRLSLVAVAVSLATPLAFAPRARAQSSGGSIGVVATILAAPVAPGAPQVRLDVGSRGRTVVRVTSSSPTASRTISQFFRLQRADGATPDRADDDQVFQPTIVDIPVPTRSSDLYLRLERLVIAGT